MLFTVIYIIPALLLLAIFNHLRISTSTVKVKNELLYLRHKMFHSMKAGEIVKTKSYEDLIKSIKSSEKNIHLLSIWMIIFISAQRSYRRSNHQTLSAFEEILSEQPKLKVFFEEYSKLTFDYFRKKSIISLTILWSIIRAFEAIKYLNNKKQNRAALIKIKRSFKEAVVATEAACSPSYNSYELAL